VLGAIAAIAGIVGSAGNAPTAAKQTTTASAATPFAAVRVVSAPAASPSTATTVAPATVAGEVGMKIYKDAEGEIGPPDAGDAVQANDGADGTSQDMAGLQKVTLPDGSIMVDLQGRFQEAMVMQITPDGKRVVTCTSDVKKTLSHPPVAPAQREER